MPAENGGRQQQQTKNVRGNINKQQKHMHFSSVWIVPTHNKKQQTSRPQTIKVSCRQQQQIHTDALEARRTDNKKKYFKDEHE